ncbi:MAG TPA: glycosyltransferase family 4 protein [Phycisphaerae bacterium]|nr:glycosyltransferase family 4 protein [Phycisphaerae bacterium]HUT59455.1 glycosyltransferase family 4 protein [Phycisphaerae bacterium]
MRKVVIVKSFVKAFRVPFYEHLAKRLRSMGIDLRLVFGQPDRSHAGETDIVGRLTIGRRTRNRYLHIGRRSLVWQPALRHLRGADLVIVQQGNRHILNHLLLWGRRALGAKLAFWGHGRNFHSPSPDGLSEGWKRICSRRVDYWFAYTERSRAVLRRLGAPDSRITVVQNAIDTARLVRDYEEVRQWELAALRKEMRMTRGDVAGIYCGRFYGLKDIDFTLRSAEAVRARNGRFHMIFVGGGAQAAKVESFCRANADWAHHAGPRYGRDKARYFRLASCQIMPGAVGLSIVDSFATLTPLITRDIASHGPEIAYLQSGANGLITEDSPDAYVDAVLKYLADKACQKRLVRGCIAARRRYTIENMASRFAEGVCKALSGKDGD